MSDNDEIVVRHLWTLDGFKVDQWVRAGDVETDRRVIVSLPAYLAIDDETRSQAGKTIGVEVQPDEALDDILPYLDRLPLIALAFPSFSDGRSYSKAEMLRSRYGYSGTIRATGQVLIDQIQHMLRSGFDELVIEDQIAIKHLSIGNVGGLPYHYQPAAMGTTKAGGYSWRRLSA